MIVYSTIPGQRKSLADPALIRRHMGILHQAFDDSDTEFYVSGSHHFGVAHALSDVDLYVQHTPEIEHFLTDCGFYRMGEGGGEKEYSYIITTEHTLEGPKSPNTVGVYAHRQLLVQVQVLENVEIGMIARDILATFFNDEHRETRGAFRGIMWTTAITAVQTILSAHAAHRSSR